MTPRRDDRPPLTLGTAGHIDHGKTALISVLTGKNTDRLPEERSRGISIELGFASLVLSSGRRLSVVDVPGHERFVRTMVAGATGFDLVLLCVAADDGVMPQTREHLAVLRRLGIERGVVAVTKADVGEPELVAEEVAELVPGAPVVAVSARERTGLEELRGALDEVARTLPGRADAGGPARLHVDRAFTLRGIGTVVTGTLWAGSVAAGDSVTILPRGLSARVRSVQVHDEPVERAAAGQRVALGLSGVNWREVERGDVVVESGAELRPTYLIDAALELEPGARPIAESVRVHVHHGTREAPARVVPLDGPIAPDGLAQLRLEAPLVPARGDRLILRQVAPPDTIGGGVVLDPAPKRRGAGASEPKAPGTGFSLSPPQAGGVEAMEEAPLAGAAEPPPLDDAAHAIAALLRADGESPRTDAELAAAAGLSQADATDRLRRLEAAGAAVRVGRNLHFDRSVLDDLAARVVAICERDGGATIAGVRDELITSRKYAQALLEHLDRSKVTRRDGDRHVLRRRG